MIDAEDRICEEFGRNSGADSVERLVRLAEYTDSAKTAACAAQRIGKQWRIFGSVWLNTGLKRHRTARCAINRRRPSCLDGNPSHAKNGSARLPVDLVFPLGDYAFFYRSMTVEIVFARRVCAAHDDSDVRSRGVFRRCIVVRCRTTGMISVLNDVGTPAITGRWDLPLCGRGQEW